MRSKRIQIDNEQIFVSQYVPYDEKNYIVLITSQSFTEDENGVKKIDYLLKQILSEYLIVRAYTKKSNIIDYSEIIDKKLEEVIETYDKLCESGIIQKVLQNIPESELKIIYNSIDAQILENLKQPDIISLIKKFVGELNFEKEEISQLLNSLNDINPENREILAEVLKLQNKK
jgi:F0F1-type ATP synthase alpha subunit